MTEDNTIPIIDWDAVRLRYEARSETVTAIAVSIGLLQSELSRHAKNNGWQMRKPQQVKSASTTETLRRLRDGLQKRLGKFEGEMKKRGRKTTKAEAGREIRDTDALLRTFERVLELEVRHKKRTSRVARELARLNDAQRDELARRIESLRDAQPDGEPHTVLETPSFAKSIKDQGLSEDERFEIVSAISRDPLQGDLIPGTGGARKIRFGGKGKGKRSAFRVVTYYAAPDLPIFLLELFAKGEKINMSQAERNEMKKIPGGVADDYRKSEKAKVTKIGKVG